jgi:hypothetical protein
MQRQPAGKMHAPALLGELSVELQGYPDLLKKILQSYEINKLSDLPVQHHAKCLERIRELKNKGEAA